MMKKRSAKERILFFLKENVGEWIHYKKIRKIAEISDWARQLRTLRQEGWVIKKRGGSTTTEYKLNSLVKGEEKKRKTINSRLRAKILHRDNYHCVHCGKNPRNDEIKLQIDHKIPIDWGGKNDENNLQTLCVECNQGKKAYFSEFDSNIMKKIIGKSSGTQRLLVMANILIDLPLDVNFIETLAGIRDWTRTLRKLRQEGKINYEYNYENKTYTFKRKVE